jgi:catechol-2,3-dioxygenase
LIALRTERKARHSALEVESLAELKELRANAQANSIRPAFALDHGCSLSHYFHDPEGNLLEVCRPTGHKTDEPISEPLRERLLPQRDERGRCS